MNETMSVTATATTVRGDDLPVERTLQTTIALHGPSWGAMWAGFFVVLGCEIVLTLLMVGVFSSFIKPGFGTPPGSGFAIGMAVWFFLQTIASFWAGGRVAGYFARAYEPASAIVHGFGVWGFATTVIIYALVNASGVALLGTLNAIRFGLGIAISGASAIGPAAGGGTGSAALNGIGAATATASPDTVAVATWIPIYLFIVFALSCAAAVGGARRRVVTVTR